MHEVYWVTRTSPIRLSPTSTFANGESPSYSRQYTLMTFANWWESTVLSPMYPCLFAYWWKSAVIWPIYRSDLRQLECSLCLNDLFLSGTLISDLRLYRSHRFHISFRIILKVCPSHLVLLRYDRKLMELSQLRRKNYNLSDICYSRFFLLKTWLSHIRIDPYRT
jgi:hypothetical protein